MTEAESGRRPEDIDLNDGLIRLVGIPLFGLCIPFVSGLHGDALISPSPYWLSSMYFITLAGIIWQGNRYLMFRTRRRFTWFHRPVEKLILLVLNNVFYTIPVTVGMLWLWYEWLALREADWAVIRIIALINVICVLFVTHVYETVFMLREQQSEQLRNEQLERAKAEAELIALRNQVDPHFMFNSLNALTYLIETDPRRGLMFAENLAEVYRYILVQKDRPLVLLEDELDFTHQYTDLLHLRFGDALLISKKFAPNAERRFLIPPNSVFMAFENAVKHNEISEQYPLRISVDVQDDMLIISNSIRRRVQVTDSPNIGLRNLEERFKLLTGRPISVKRDETIFSIEMPLISVTTSEL
jgi:hypothetical protein